MNLEKNNILNILIKNDALWTTFAKEITKNSKTPYKDLLHDFYIIIHNKVKDNKLNILDIMHNDLINKAFIYKMLKNIFLDQIKKEKDIQINYNLDYLLKADNEPYIDIYKQVDDIVDQFYWFDKKLFNLYRKKFHSIRKLSAATNISHVVVWKTINNCIKEIKKKINEK